MNHYRTLISAATLAAAAIGGTPAFAAGLTLTPVGQFAARPAAVRAIPAPAEPGSADIGAAAPAAPAASSAKPERRNTSSTYALQASLYRAPAAPAVARYPR
jgi:hypothetical protein